MVKEFLSKKHLKSIENQENDESDLDLEEEFEEDEAEGIEFPNDEEKLTEFTNKIKEEFQRYYTSKGKNPTWLETMTLTGNIGIPEELDVDDDIKRELIFYNISHKNTIQGIIKLKEAHEKLNRPGDFFAEMLKSDNQMMRIRKKIVTEQQRIKKFEDKKQKLQNVKFAKAMKDSQAKSKAEYKKKTREGLENWKKNIKSNPDSYDKIDDFFNGKNQKGNKFGGSNNKKGNFGGNKFGGRGGKNDSKFKNNKAHKKQAGKRPGKITRMNNRNKKFSKKSK